MKVKTQSERAKKSREMVFELLLADQPPLANSHDPKSSFWDWVGAMGIAATSRFPARRAAGSRQLASGHRGQSRRLHPLQSLRPRLPRGAGQRRDRHGLSRPRRQGRVRLRRPDGRLDLRRLRRMRAGLPDRRADGDRACSTRPACASNFETDRSTRSAPIAASAARRRCTSRTTRSSTSTAATARPTTTASASRAASASTTSTIPTG